MPDLALEVNGMTCAGCAARAQRALAAVDGVTEASVNYATGKAQVHYDAPATPDALENALSDAGYPAEVSVLQLEVEGLSCASCAARSTRAMEAVPGVISAPVNFADGTARIRYLAGSATAADIAAASTEAGYPATARAEPENRPEPGAKLADEARALRRDAVIAACLTLPVFIIEMGGHMIPALHHWVAATIGQGNSHLLQFLLTTLVLAGPGRRFYRVGIPALLRGAPEMNSLVALGTFAAWAYSSLATFAPALLPENARAVYFESAAMIVVLILVGRWLEARAKGRAGEAIRALVGLRPATARVERDGDVTEVPLETVRRGDILRLVPGASVPLDGVVISGSSLVDESMLTGEPVPVAKSAGAQVTGGTVNGNGALRVRVEATGGDTVLSRILAMVEEAQAARLPIQSLVDRITLRFVPAVLAVALGAFLLWLGLGGTLAQALVAGVSVLIIACPCAMGLATPTSIVVGTGRAARLGVFFRRGDALQSLQGVRAVAFDKTGTLTEGRPALARLSGVNGADGSEALRLAAAAEAQSEHPLAHALIEAAQARDPAPLPEAQDVAAEPGFGLAARVEGHAVLIGNGAFMSREGIDAGSLETEVAEAAARGETPVFIAIDGNAAALATLADPVRPGAAPAIAALRARGLRTVLLTGDTAATAEAVAGRLGLDQVEAGLLPGDKLARLDALRDTFGPVAFVGDGINDAP
ncbi:MAG: heavy metal translocating P-type ATPase, partial [Pseudooceanicola sp.]